LVLNHNKPFNTLLPRLPFPLLLIAFSFPTRAVAQGTPCSPEPTDIAISYSSIVGCAIDVAGDTDIFRFDGMSGESITMLVLRSGGGGVPCIELYSPVARVAGPACGGFGGTSARIDYTLTSTGTYTIRVRESGDDDIYQYNLSAPRNYFGSPERRRAFKLNVVV
jgi:hypothetical protein